MTDDQQRARELWADALRKVGQHEYAYHVGCGGDLDPSEQATLDAITAALRAAPEWQRIETAPHDDRVLVRCESGSVYATHWVQNPATGDEAWLVCALEDGTQMLVHPVDWMPLPASARPQGVKDAG